MKREVAITIPAFQAAASVAGVVSRALEEAATVVVVDDGSSDGTGARAADAGAEVVRHPRNLGKGAALKTAFSLLFGRGFAAVVTIDADGQHLPEESGKLVAAWDAGADLVLGTRVRHFGGMNRVRRTSNRWSSRAISVLAGQRFDDIQTGFRLYTQEVIEKVGFPEPRFEAESAVIVRAARAGFDVVTVPAELGFADGRVSSHYRPVVDSLRIARAVIWARLSWVRPA